MGSSNYFLKNESVVKLRLLPKTLFLPLIGIYNPDRYGRRFAIGHNTNN